MRILIVGAGLYGAVCAERLSRAGHLCRVIEKRDHIGGNIYTRYHEAADCQEHVYGPHIFHTDSREIWDYMGKFCQFLPYVHRLKVRKGRNLYSFPVNLFTLHQIAGVVTPQEAQEWLAGEVIAIEQPTNMEEYCLSTIGPTLYRMFIEAYTVKQWGRHPRQLPAAIVKRLPVRLTFEDSHSLDRLQGIPVGGYTAIIEKMVQQSMVEIQTDFFHRQEQWIANHDLVIYTGSIDRFFQCKWGVLAYRTMRFNRVELPIADYQGAAVINYADADVPHTRIIEHKHFEMKSGAPHTLLSYEYPEEWHPEAIECYPVNTEENNHLYRRYRQEADRLSGKVHFGGRLGEYQYYDMHQVVKSALKFCATVGG